MPTPSIQTLRADAQQVLNLDSISAVRSVVAATLANANAGTPLNPNLTTQQLWNEFYQIVTQPKSDIESIIANQLMKFLFAPPAPGGAGADKQVIFNDGGVLAGDPQFLWNKTTNLLTVTGSATITGDLTVRTNKLFVNATGVGVGTTSLFGDLNIQNGSNCRFEVTSQAGGTTIENLNNARNAYLNMTMFADAYIWNRLGSEAMRLNSTGLGVGTTVQYARLTVAGTNSTGIANIQNSPFASNTLGSLSCYIGHDGTANRPFIQAASGNAGIAFDLLIQPYGGNVGIGVTPSAWGSAFKVVQTGQALGVYGRANLGYYGTKFNLYNDNTNDVAITTNYVGEYRFELLNGSHVWLNKSSAGTAGANQTLTQAMTLTAAGNLAVGVATTANRLDVQNSTDCTVLVKSTGANAAIAMDYVSNYGNHTIRKSGTAVWDYGVINDSSATPAFKVSNASSVGVQLVSGATSWTTLSDETMKDIIEPISNAVSKVGLIRSVIGKFKTDDASKRRSFLIAQDVQSVLPEAVDVIGENNELGLRYTEVIPLLVAAIKELTARVQTLEAK